MNILVISEFPTQIDTYLKMIPGAYHPYVTREAIENQRDPFAAMNLPHHLKIVYFLGAMRLLVSRKESNLRLNL